MYGAGEKRQRGGRKKKKRKENQPLETDWDEIYDPSKPTNFDEYMHSEERIREIQDWKAVLYRHRRRRSSSDGSDASRDRARDDRSAPSMATPLSPSPPNPVLPLEEPRN